MFVLYWNKLKRICGCLSVLPWGLHSFGINELLEMFPCSSVLYIYTYIYIYVCVCVCVCVCVYIYIYIFQCHHMSFVDFVVLPPGHDRNVTDFWCWNAHEAQLCCPDGVWVVIEEDVVPGGALNLKSTNLPRPWSQRESSPSRKIPTVEPGIEPGTSWLVVRDSDH